ncbi:MAG: TIGR03435 family protein, partial [Acidobacteriota bacterium]
APTENAPGVTKNLPAAPAEFEVAEVKPSAPGTKAGGGFHAGGRIDLQAISLKTLVGIGWNFDDENMITGAPKWAETELYDIVARAPATGPRNEFPPEDTLRLMLRSLVADRFKLSAHTEDRPVPVYELLPGKRPHKMKPADPDSRSECKISVGQTGTGGATIPLRIYTCQNTTMAQLAERIRPVASAYLDHPVVNMTGLEGGWDFVVSWTGKGMVQAARKQASEDGGVADPSGRMTVFEAVDRQLGLRLEGGRKQPQPVLVIDHAEPPAKN